MKYASLVLSSVVLLLICGSTSEGRSQHDNEAIKAEQAAACASCTGAVSLLQGLLDSGASEEDLLNAAVGACYALVPDEGWNPDTLCQVSIDTYGPHVIYILNVTDKTALEICTLYNKCPHSRSAFTAKASTADKSAVPPTSREFGPRKAINYTNAFKVIHFTDIHIDHLYAEGTPTQCDMPLCCRADSNGTGWARHWGDFECNIPYRTFDLALNFLAQNFDPDIVVYTGDHVQHTVWDQTLSHTAAVSQHVTDRIATYFPGIPAYYSLGNHDINPTNLYYEPRVEIQAINSIIYNHWELLSNFGPSQQQTFQAGAYYAVDHGTKLKVIGYNSNYGALDNFYNILNIDSAYYFTMKQFMETQLQLARLSNQKVLFLGHHTTGSSGRVREYSEFITDLHARYPDVIILHLLGHSHSDSFTLVRDLTTNVTQGVQISSPSLTSYTDVNPSVRIFYLEPLTLDVLDMDTYHLDLNVDADKPNPELKFVYRATDEYNMADLSPASFDDLVNRMEADRTLLNLYRFNKETRSHVPGLCDERCAHKEICDLRYSDYDRRLECENAAPP